MNYHKKYLKYKIKYLNLIKLIGGIPENFIWLIDKIKDEYQQLQTISDEPPPPPALIHSNISGGIKLLKDAIKFAIKYRSQPSIVEYETIGKDKLDEAKSILQHTNKNIDYITWQNIIDKSKEDSLQFLNN